MATMNEITGEDVLAGICSWYWGLEDWQRSQIDMELWGEINVDKDNQ